MIGDMKNDNDIKKENDKDSTDSDKEKKKRSTKEELYEEERKEIINELEKMMGLTNEKRTIMFHDLNENEKIKERMKELSEEIKKIYRVSSWGYYSKDEKKGSGNEIALLRSVFKNSGYNIESKRKTVKINNETKIKVQLGFYKIK